VEHRAELQPALPAAMETGAAWHGSLATRKGVALARFVDLQRDFCSQEDDGALEGRLRRLAECRAFRVGWLGELAACGDDSLLEAGSNNSFLQTLDQIIEMEDAETKAQQQREAREARQAAALEAQTVERRRSKRGAAAAGAGSGSSSSSSKRRRGGASAAPAEYLCPILKEPMKEPVVAQDGQTYERSAIEQWLRTRNSSPLTGLPLSHKELTPNLLLRGMIRQWLEASA